MAARNVDWSKLGWCMTQSVKVGPTNCSMFANGGARFAAFKTESDNVMNAFASANKREVTIDFEEYKKALPEKAEWIANIQKNYESAKVPKPVDTLSESINADDSKVVKAVADAAAALDAAGKDAVNELSLLKRMAPANQLTFADIYKNFPELNPFTPEEMHKYYWDPQYTRDVDLLKSDMRADNVDGERAAEDNASFKPAALAKNTDMDLDLFGFKKA